MRANCAVLRVTWGMSNCSAVAAIHKSCGPGKVLAGLVKRIDPSLSAYTVSDPVTLADVKAALA